MILQLYYDDFLYNILVRLYEYVVRICVVKLLDVARRSFYYDVARLGVVNEVDLRIAERDVLLCAVVYRDVHRARELRRYLTVNYVHIRCRGLLKLRVLLGNVKQYADCADFVLRVRLVLDYVALFKRFVVVALYEQALFCCEQLDSLTILHCVEFVYDYVLVVLGRRDIRYNRYGRLSICLVVCVRNNHYLCRVILCHVEYDCVVRCVVFEHGVVTDCEILRIVGVRRDVEDKRVFVYVYVANLTRCTLINRICEDFVLREVVFVNLTRRCVVLRRVDGYNLTVGVLLKCDELVFNVAVFRQRCEYLLCVLAACTVYTNLVRCCEDNGFARPS